MAFQTSLWTTARFFGFICWFASCLQQPPIFSLEKIGGDWKFNALSWRRRWIPTTTSTWLDFESWWVTWRWTNKHSRPKTRVFCVIFVLKGWGRIRHAVDRRFPGIFLCIYKEFVWMGQFTKKTPLAPLICTPPPATSSWVFRDRWSWAFLAEENPSVLGFRKSYHGVVWHGDDSHVPWMAKWSDGILLITDVCFEGTGYLYVHIAIYIAQLTYLFFWQMRVAEIKSFLFWKFCVYWYLQSSWCVSSQCYKFTGGQTYQYQKSSLLYNLDI